METRNPIVRTLSGGGWLDKAPVSSTVCQWVVIPKKGQPYVLPAGVNLRGADFRGASVIHEVSVTSDQFELDNGSADSSQDTFGFTFHANTTYRVADPLKIVHRNVTDMRADVRRLITAAVNAVTRDCNPHQLGESQRTVRRKVEGEDGTVAQRLQANGYALEEVQITLSRDGELIEMERGGWRTEKKRQDKVDEVTHVERFLRGDLVTRMSYLSTLGPEEQIRAINELSEIEKARISAAMNIDIEILKHGLPELSEHKRKQLIDRARKNLNTEFNASRLLQDDGAPNSAGSSGSAPKNQSQKLPSGQGEEDDDWEDE